MAKFKIAHCRMGDGWSGLYLAGGGRADVGIGIAVNKRYESG